jgi:hypothetical protein
MTDETSTSVPDMRDVSRRLAWAELLQYVAGGLIGGGGAVTVGLLVSGVEIQRQSYIGLLVIYDILLVAGGLLSWGMADARRAVELVDALWAPILTIVLSVEALMGSSHFLPARPYTSSWWSLVAAGLIVAMSGCLRRIRVNRHIERLKSFGQTAE